MNNRDKGKQLEEYVAERLKEVLHDSSIRPTKASSGGSHNTEVGDLLSSQYFVECKNNKNNWFRKKVWTELLNSLPLGTTKVPLYVIKEDIEGILVMLSFEDLCRILEKKL